MAGQAGWYPAPNEAGLVRYWNGEAWTEHRQPMPTSAPAVAEPIVAEPAAVAPEPVAPEPIVEPPVVQAAAEPIAPEPLASEPTSELSATELAMIEFERQFEKQAAQEYAHANTQPTTALDGSTTVAAAPAVEIQSSPPSRFAPVPAPAKPVASVADMWSMVSDEDAAPQPAAEFASPASASPALAPTLAATAPALLLAPEPEAQVETQPGRSPSLAPVKKRRSGGALGMIIGAIVIIVGLGIFGYLAFEAMPEAGEGIANGVVTDLGASTLSTGGAACAPVARFAVLGDSYTATTSKAVTSCPVTLGQSVKVIYDVKAPSTSGRIQVAGPFADLVWLVPLTGLIVFIASLIAFMRSRSKAAPIS